MQKQLAQLGWRSILTQGSRSSMRRCSDRGVKLGEQCIEKSLRLWSAKFNTAAVRACSDDTCKMKQQQQSLLVPPGRRPSLRERQDQNRHGSPRQLQQQERQQEEEEQQQHSSQKRHSGEQQDGRREGPQNTSVSQRVDTCTKKEEIQQVDKRAASGQSVTSAVSFLRALWPGVRDTVATEEDCPKGESDRRSSCSKRIKEGHDFRATDTSNNKLAAFFSPLGGRGTGRKRSTTGGRRLLSSTSLPSYSSAGGEVSSSTSSRRSGWSAAGGSAGAPLSLRPSSLFASWLPTSVASFSSSSSPHGVSSGSKVSSHSVSTTDAETVKKSWVAAADSEGTNWFACNNVSSSDCIEKSPTKRAGRSSSGRQAAADWRGEFSKLCVSDRLKAVASISADPCTQRRQSQGSRSEVSNKCQGGKNSFVEADPREGSADDTSVLGVSTALVQAGREREAGIGAGAEAAHDSTAAAEDRRSGHPEEGRETGKRGSAVGTRSRRISEEKQLWEQQHSALGCGMADRHALGYRVRGTVERRDIMTAIGGRDRERDTKLQRRRRELAGGGSSRAQFFFSLHGTRNLRQNTMSQEQQQQPIRERLAPPAAAPFCTEETKGVNNEEGKKESNAKETEGGEEEASSSSFGWMDQLRKVLKQTSLLGGQSADAAKKSKSRQSGVCTPVTTPEETGTEEELSDSELLLLQGISIAKLSEEAVQQASHGSEPCNVLVCVEPAATASASSSFPVAAVAATVSNGGFKDIAAAARVGEAAAPPRSPRSTASGSGSVQSSAESFSGLWETTSVFPPSFASLAAAVNIRPWLAADAAVPLPSDDARSNDNSSSNVRNSSSSDQSLSATGRGPSERSTGDSSSSSTRSSQPGAAAVEEADMSTREDFESLFARCRSSVTNEKVSVSETAALPLHGVAVLRADGTTKTYWRVPVQLQQEQQLWQQQQQQRRKRREQQSSNIEEKQSPQQEEGGNQPKGDKVAASGATEKHGRAKGEPDWMFVPLQQPIQEVARQPQHPEMQQQQQERKATWQGEDQKEHSQKRAQPAETPSTGGAVQHQREDRQQQQMRDRPESFIDSSSSGTPENISQLDAWSVELADVSTAGAAPPGSSNVEARDISNRKNSGNTNDSSRCRRSSQEKIGAKIGSLGSPLRNREDSKPRSFQQQQSVQPEEAGTSTISRQKDAQEVKGAEFLGTKRRSVSAARGAKSWAQYKYNNASQRRSRGTVEVGEQDMSGEERHSGRAAADHSLRIRSRAADDAGDVSPAEKAAAALGTAGPAPSLLARSSPTGTKRTEEGRTQQQPTGWWSEFSKGLADFFTQQQVLLPDVDVRYSENLASPASSRKAPAAAEQQQHHGEAAAPPLLPLYTPLGFSFSPAGLLGPYHLGVVSLLSEANVINEYTPVAGASAGSLAAVAVGLNLSTAAVMSSVEHVNQDLKERGTAQRLGKRLRKELNRIMPEDCAILLGKRPGKVTVTYTHVFPYIHGAFVSSFFGKSDLIDCLMASCNIPFYFSKWPTITCRGKQCVDGFFATKHKTFGCPDTGALRDIKVVPFYASTVRVSSAAQDCINPDLQMHDEQILHYLRAKALLRARARLLREQMQQQRQQQKRVQSQQAEGQQHIRQQKHHQEHAQKRRGSTSTLGSDDGSVLESSWLPLLPSICPLHGAGPDGKKQQQRVVQRGTDVQRKVQSSAEDDSTRSDISAAVQADGGDPPISACTALPCRHADTAAATCVSATRNKQHGRGDGAVPSSSAIALGEDSTKAETSFSDAASSLLTSAYTKGSSSAEAADVGFPATPLDACNCDSSASSQDAQFIPTGAVPSSSSDAVFLSGGALTTPVHSAAGGALPCGRAFPAAAVPLPAAAAAAAEIAAQRGEKVCAFESIYACPVCSPLGEICPPHHFSYYYHDPTSATFGCGAITTSASFNAEQAAVGGSTVAAAPPTSASIATTTAGSPSDAAANRTTDIADAAGVITLAPAAELDATSSAIPGDVDIIGAHKPGTARLDAGSSSSGVTVDAADVTAARTPSIDQFVKGKGPAGPVAALTTLGAAAGALKTAAEETLDADTSSKDNTNGKSSIITNINSSSRSNGVGSADDLTEVPAQLSAALSSIVPPHAPGAARTYSSTTDVLPASSLANAECSAPAAAVDDRAGRVSFLEPLQATDTTSLSASSTSMTARSADDATAPMGCVASTAAQAEEAATASATTATRAPAVELPPAAVPASETAKTGSASTTARQRRRLRACKDGGGLCMRENCGCTALPPLLRLSCSTQELLQIALEASPNETLRELFDLGRADAFRWLVLEYMRCEDDLIHRRAAAAKAAHQQQQTPAADSDEANATLASSTACNRGDSTSTSNNSRLTESSGSLMPALRQRWKLVSNRWGRSADSGSTKTSSSGSSSGDHHHRASASTPVEEGGGPALRSFKREEHERALSSLPVTASLSPATKSTEGASHGTSQLAMQGQRGEQEKSLVKKQSTRRLRALNAADMLHSYVSGAAAAPPEPTVATCFGERHVAVIGAEEDMPVALAPAEQTVKRCAGSPAPVELEEESLTLKHAATAPGECLTTSNHGDAAAASSLPSVHSIEDPPPTSAETESFAISVTATAPSTGRLAPASTEKVKDAAVCSGEGGTAKPSKGAGAADHDCAGKIPHDNEKPRAQTDRDIAREMWQALEKKQYKEMLEKELAGVFPGSDRRRRSTTCTSHGAMHQRSRSLPPATVASPTTICKRCRTSRVQGARALAGVCAACQSDMTLLSAAQERKTSPETAEPDRLMQARSGTCAETQADRTSSSSAESGTLGGFLPALLLLKDASLSARYAHIYTHSNLWNGDGSRCMRPEEHTL